MGIHAKQSFASPADDLWATLYKLAKYGSQLYFLSHFLFLFMQE